MKILLLSQDQSMQHNCRHELFKQEIARQHDVRFYGPKYEGFSHFDKIRDIEDIMKLLGFRPDVIFSYLAKHSGWATGLFESEIRHVHYVADYVPIQWNDERLLWIGRDEDPFIRENIPHLVVCPNWRQVSEISEQHPHSIVRRLPFSVNTDVFKSDGSERDIDISAVMTTEPRYYPTRPEIVEAVDKMPNSIAIGGKGYHKERVGNEEYVDILSRSKIVVNSTSLREGDWRPLNPRFTEAMACGAMLLTESADDMKRMGFKPSDNCDTFEDINEMLGKAIWYLNHEEERARVARNGMKLTRLYHSCERRVKQLTKMIERIL